MNFHLMSLFTCSAAAAATTGFWFVLILCTKAQQLYSGNSVMTCNNSDQAAPSPAFLYSCNGEYTSCGTFLIFRALFPYISVPMIATLTSSDQTEMARINNVTRLTVFPEGREVIVPVNCSCAGRYYRAITKYDIRTSISSTTTTADTLFTVANNTYQGLSTCDGLRRTTGDDDHHEFGLQVEDGLDFELEVPLRCACPTKKQAADGMHYLLTYTVTWNDDLSSISSSFNVSRKSVADANGFLEEDATIFPFTTLLIPLTSEPLRRLDFTSDNYQNRTPSSVLPLPVHVPRSRRKLPVRGIIAAASSSCLLVLVFVALFILRIRLARIRRMEGKRTAEDGYSRDIHVEIASIDRLVKIFKYKELRKATGNFGSKSRIEGCVFRGVLHREEVIAIKKMGKEAAAYNEVNMLSTMNHFNLIKLRGYCEHEDQLFLVFDYMKNGSLRQWLRSKGTKFTAKEGRGWSQRIQIAMDIANGLLYLHNFAKPAYVHKDINSSNILLDSNLRAKISNFGFARTAAVEGTSSDAVTRRVVGTKGYMAPEYIKTGLVTQKIDVYAFGVVMLELITAKDPVVVREGRDILLAAEIAAMAGENATDGLRNLIEPDLGENGKMEYAFQIINLSLSCLAQNPVNRPNMDDVVSALIKIQSNVQKSDCSV